MNGAIVPFAVLRGGRRPKRRSARPSSLVQKVEKLQALDPGVATFLEGVIDRMLRRAVAGQDAGA